MSVGGRPGNWAPAPAGVGGAAPGELSYGGRDAAPGPMIDSWSVVPTRHANLDPEWHYAGRDVPELPGVRVALRAGLVIGEGYAPFLPHLDASPEALEQSARQIASAMPGAPVVSPHQGVAALSHEEGCALARLGPCERTRNAARSAVEMALLDLSARLAGISVVALLGGRACPVSVLRIIPVKPPEAMARLAGALVAEGYRALKLKATGALGADLARVAAVRSAVGPEVALIVDANQSYDVAGSVSLEVGLRALGVWSLEQPVPARDRAALGQVRDGAEVRIEADEGLFCLSDVDAVAGAADGISLKLARSGGLLPSLAMARAARDAGQYARIGTAFGGPLVTLATATLAALHPCTGAAECAEFLHFDDHDHAWPEVRDGLLHLPEGPGFGQTATRAWSALWQDGHDPSP